MKFKEWLAKEMTDSSCVASFARPTMSMQTRTWPEPVVLMNYNKRKPKKVKQSQKDWL
jgi:hypothetical protein